MKNIPYLWLFFLQLLSHRKIRRPLTKENDEKYKSVSQLSVIGKLGPFNVNFKKFGELPNSTNTNLNNKKFDRLLGDKFNLASGNAKMEKLYTSGMMQKGILIAILHCRYVHE